MIDHRGSVKKTFKYFSIFSRIHLVYQSKKYRNSKPVNWTWKADEKNCAISYVISFKSYVSIIWQMDVVFVMFVLDQLCAKVVKIWNEITFSFNSYDMTSAVFTLDCSVTYSWAKWMFTSWKIIALCEDWNWNILKIFRKNFSR